MFMVDSAGSLTCSGAAIETGGSEAYSEEELGRELSSAVLSGVAADGHIIRLGTGLVPKLESEG